MSRTGRSNSRSNHNYDNDNDHATYDDMSDEVSGSSSNEEDIVTPRSTKSRKMQPTDASDFEEGGGMYDRSRRHKKSKKGKKGKKSRSRSRRRR